MDENYDDEKKNPFDNDECFFVYPCFINNVVTPSGRAIVEKASLKKYNLNKIIIIRYNVIVQGSRVFLDMT